MGRFNGRGNFAPPLPPPDTPPDPDEDNGDGLPTPLIVKVTARRMAGLKEATQALSQLPEPGESLHVVATARHDLTDTLAALLTRLGRCELLMIATLGYNEKNLRALLQWLDEGSVKSVGLVTSLFFRAHKRALWEQTLTQFRQRRQRAAACHSHSKVITLAFTSGVKLSLSGSANLCGNGSGREQFELTNHDELCLWHSAWIGELLDRHEGKEQERKAADDAKEKEKTARTPTLF